MARLLNNCWHGPAMSAHTDAAHGARAAASSPDGGDRRLGMLSEEIDALDGEASGIEARLERALFALNRAESKAPTRKRDADPRELSEQSKTLRAQLDIVIERLAEIPFEMARTPAATVKGILIKLRQLEASLSAGSADSDVPLLQSISADLVRLHPD